MKTIVKILQEFLSQDEVKTVALLAPAQKNLSFTN